MNRSKWMLAGLLLPLMIGCGGMADDEEIGSSQTGAVTAIPADFDLVSFGTLGGLPRLKVLGQAGGTRAQAGSNEVLAYIFVTDAGTFALASQSAKLLGSVFSNIYFGYKITLSSSGCVTSSSTTGTPMFLQNTAYILGTPAKKVTQVSTVRLVKTSAGLCIQQTFDSLP